MTAPKFSVTAPKFSVTAIVPAAGIGQRMQADRPKQYLTIDGKTVLEHTLERLLSHSAIGHILVAINEDDRYFGSLPIAAHPKVSKVYGSCERADTVMAALCALKRRQMTTEWVLVHDAVRPCVSLQDIDTLMAKCRDNQQGGLLATPVRDTIKSADREQNSARTLDRRHLWQAMTPQMFPTMLLSDALNQALEQGLTITDEASAMEAFGYAPQLVSGSATNIKITHPEDLAMAECFLTRK